ncbi:hypothetical protein Salat_1663100 [Sesamum alatum]|uniref:Uncharacterized protein n=1 Tax=Sesamum alatum TaxID=300844 RepID=A0AAE1Y6X9_9LAMI|nr:hypothetical protein Salat_1663100 [Sesamum alatum]
MLLFFRPPMYQIGLNNLDVWIRPRGGVVKINFDCATFRDCNAMGVGLRLVTMKVVVLVGKQHLCATSRMPKWLKLLALKLLSPWLSLFKVQRWKSEVILGRSFTISTPEISVSLLSALLNKSE